MKKNTLKYALAVIAPISLAAYISTAAAQVAPADVLNLESARQESQIATTYHLSPYLRSHDIQVKVTNGQAVLTGSVEDDISKELARQIALSTPGIQTVQNDIAVEPGSVSEKLEDTELSFGRKVEDASITAAVKMKLLWSRHAAGFQTEISTVDGVVTLQGTAASAQARELAELMAINTTGVVSVNNRLSIDTAASATTHANGNGNGESGNGQLLTDTWITTKVKSTLTMSSNIHSRDISVTTTNGIVALNGIVRSSAEQAAAVDVASQVRGVRRVDASNLKVQ